MEMGKQVEKIREEIERRKKEYCNGLDSVTELYDSLLSFIDSLQEESVSEEQIMKDAIEREVKVDAGGYPYIDSTELYDYDNEKPLAKAGDKVKILIIKE